MGVQHDDRCHVAALAKTLAALAGDGSRAKVGVAGLLTEQGVGDGPAIEASARAELAGRTPQRSYALEDLLLRFLYDGMTPADWKSASLAHPSLFLAADGLPWFEGVVARHGSAPPWHEIEECLAYVALLCNDRPEAIRSEGPRSQPAGR